MDILRYVPLWMRNPVNAEELARKIDYRHLDVRIGLDVTVNDKVNVTEIPSKNSLYFIRQHRVFVYNIEDPELRFVRHIPYDIHFGLAGHLIENVNYDKIKAFLSDLKDEIREFDLPIFRQNIPEYLK